MITRPRLAMWTCLVAVSLGAVGPHDAAAEATDTVAPLLWQPSTNVFRRFAVDRAKMIEFYGYGQDDGWTPGRGR